MSDRENLTVIIRETHSRKENHKLKQKFGPIHSVFHTGCNTQCEIILNLPLIYIKDKHISVITLWFINFTAPFQDEEGIVHFKVRCPPNDPVKPVQLSACPRSFWASSRNVCCHFFLLSVYDSICSNVIITFKHHKYVISMFTRMKYLKSAMFT